MSRQITTAATKIPITRDYLYHFGHLG